MAKKNKYRGFALYHPGTGLISMRTIRYAKHQVREEAVETERHYALDGEDMESDSKIWKRLYGQGYRIISVEVFHISNPVGTVGDRS